MTFGLPILLWIAIWILVPAILWGLLHPTLKDHRQKRTAANEAFDQAFSETFVRVRDQHRRREISDYEMLQAYSIWVSVMGRSDLDVVARSVVLRLRGGK